MTRGEDIDKARGCLVRSAAVEPARAYLGTPRILRADGSRPALGRDVRYVSVAARERIRHRRCAMSPRRVRRAPEKTRPDPVDQVESWPDGDWVVRPVPGAAATKLYRCPMRPGDPARRPARGGM